MSTSVLRRRLSASLLLALAACGGDDGGNPGGFAVSGPSSALDVVAGGSATTTITVARSGSFAGPVLLGFADLPDGVTATATPATIAAGATTSTVTVSVAAGRQPAGASFTVRAVGEGMPARTISVPLVIREAPGFSVSLAPAAASVQQGQATTITVNLVRAGGFAGAVDVAVDGLPAGVTASAASTTGSSATVTLTAAEGATPGDAALTVRATAPGMAERTAAATLTVTEAPGFSFVLDASTVRFERGRGGVAVATLDRAGGFAGPVSFAVEGLPADVTASTSTTGEFTTIAFTSTTAAVPGTTALTVRATSAGLPDRTAPLTLVVTEIPGTPIQSGVPVTGLAGAALTEHLFRIAVPAGAARIEARLTGGTGDADLYLDQHSPPPSPQEALCGSEGPASEEVCTVGTPTPGDWYVLVRGHAAFAGVTLVVTVTPATTTTRR